MQQIECPICHQKMKNLKMHLFYKHKMRMDEFHSQYPNFGPTQITVTQKKQKCQYCNDDKLYSPSGLGTHIAYIHKNIKRNDPKNKTKKYIKKEGYLCPICGLVFKNFSQHVELTHKLEWDKFVKKYNWVDDKAFVSHKHRQNLSINKKEFYQTEKGKKLRRQQSIQTSGQGNMIYLPGVRDKISAAAANRLITNNNTNINIGIHSLYKNLHFRSKQELKIALLFDENDISFEYESKCFTYVDELQQKRRYVPDFFVKDFVIEVKSNYAQQDEHKYQQISKQFGDKFIFGTPIDIANFFKLKKRDMLIQSFFIEKCKTLLKNKQIVFKQYRADGNFAFFKLLDKNYYQNPIFICKTKSQK